MCGICGIVSNAYTKKDVIERMSAAMVHRGPDGHGYFHDENISLAHRRLAIIDLSEGGKQPQQDTFGKLIITFNGEIFNYKKLKAELNEYHFKSESDTEVILAAYLHWGIDFAKKLKGQFAIAIWDKENQELVLARDRIGEKPLYYYHGEGLFLFASELRAILASGMVNRKININAVKDYLYYQSNNQPLTLVENVFMFPSGSIGVFKNDTLKIEKYYNFGDSEFPQAYYRDPHITVKNLFRSAVEGQMQSDVPLGAFLSGGIDSSAVVGQMAQLSDKAIYTFNISFNERDYDESSYANLIAKKFNTRHTKITIDPTVFISDLDEILSKVDNPSGDGPNTYIVSRAVKNEGITVALSGLGGDDLFAGYSGFKNYYNLYKIRHLFKVPGLLKLLYGAKNLIRNDQVTNASKVTDVLNSRNLDLIDFYSLTRQVFSYKEVNKLTHNNEIIDQLKFNNRAISGSLVNLPVLSKYSVYELSGYTKNVLLKDSDCMSMANSLEIRCPFLDHELVDFVLSVDDGLKYPSSPKKLLIESLNGLLPDEIVNRKKMGFSFPWNSWLRNELKTFVDYSINNLIKREILNPIEVQNLYSAFLANDNSVKWSKIWLLVSLESWLENNNF